MSLSNDLGRNISRSVNVLRETYKNLNLLFNEMDMIGKELGFIPLTSKFHAFFMIPNRIRISTKFSPLMPIMTKFKTGRKKRYSAKKR